MTTEQLGTCDTCKTEWSRRSPQRVQDPAVAHRRKRRVRFVIANNDTQAAILTRRSKASGNIWKSLDVYGMHNVRISAQIAEVGRAAVAFYENKPPRTMHEGSLVASGILFAKTFDGGLHWTHNRGIRRHDAARLYLDKGGAIFAAISSTFSNGRAITMDASGRLRQWM